MGKTIGSYIHCNDQTVWEFKFTNSLKRIHVLQLVIYSWLTDKSNLILYNIKTGEQWKITVNQIEHIIKKIIEERFHKPVYGITDADFIRKLKEGFVR